MKTKGKRREEEIIRVTIFLPRTKKIRIRRRLSEFTLDIIPIVFVIDDEEDAKDEEERKKKKKKGSEDNLNE